MGWLPLAPLASSAATARGARRPAVPAIVRFTLPSLAAMLMAATLLYCLFLYSGGRKLFRDSDTGWHIRNGEQIIARRALPTVDPYSFSKPNRPWVAWEWGADVLMGLANRMGGLKAAAALFALAIACVSWLWARLNFAMDGDFLLTGLFAPLMITTASPHWLARPHVFGWLLLLGWMIFLEKTAHASPGEWPRKGELGLAAVFTALWANVHGSFILAPAIAGCYAVSHFVRPYLWPLDTRAGRAAAGRYLRIALVAGVGSLLNPYGWRLDAHVFGYLANTRLLAQIAEFQSFNFRDPSATQIALVMALGALGGALALTQKKVAHFLVAAFFLWGGLRYARMLPLVALAVLPIANSAIAAALRHARGLRQPLLDRLDAALAYSARLRRIDREFHGALLIAAAVALSFLVPGASNGVGFPPDAFPVSAAEAVAKLPADARILSSDSFGGYLIYRFHGARKVFFDGRSDFYGAGFLERYAVLDAARAGWREIAAGYHFTHALLPTSSTLAGALAASGWKTLYQDRVATLLESR